MTCFDLVSNIVKILAIYYSYNGMLKTHENFKSHILKMEKILRIWRIRDLSIAGKVTGFKSLIIPNIVHLALVKTVPNSIT